MPGVNIDLNTPFQIGNTRHMAPLRDMLAFGSGAQTQVFEGVAAGLSQVTVQSVPLGMQPNLGWVVFKPYTAQCQIRRATAINGNDLTLSSALTQELDAGDAVLWTDSPAINVKWFGATGTYEDNVSTAISAVVGQLSTGEIYFPNVEKRSIYRFQSAVTIPRGFELNVDSGTILWMDHASAKINPQQPIHAEWFGADCQAAATGNGCSISAGSNLLTVDAASTFLIGNGVVIPGAGVAGADLVARIVAINGLVFTLDRTASTGVSGVRCLGDDSLPLQSMFDACANNITTNSHEFIVVPGITQISQPITIPYSCQLRGSGRYWDKIIGYADSLIVLGGNLNVEITRLMFSNGKPGGKCIDSGAYTFIDGFIKDCWFVGYGSAYDSVAIDCLFSTTTIENCVFEFMDIGIKMRANSGYVNIDNCLFSDLNNIPIWMAGGSSTKIRNVNISNITCPIWNPGGSLPCLIRAEYTEELNISNVSSRNQLDGTVGYFYNAFRFTACYRVNISNVSLLNVCRTGADGFYVASCNQISIKGFFCQNDAGREPLTGFNIQSCGDFYLTDFYLEGTENEGILMSGTNVNINISNGRIIKTGVDDNAKASIKPVAVLMHVRDMYFGGGASYSDYVIDPSALPSTSWFRIEKFSYDAYPGGLWDTSTFPAGAYICARDIDIGGQVATFTANDTTPSVADGSDVYKTNNTSATITTFDNGYAGQTIRVIFNDSNTTVDFTGTNLKGNDGVDWSPDTGDAMICFYDGTNWYCSIIKD